MTTTIDGIRYEVHLNDDPECPISLTRIYKAGEQRIIQSGTHKVTQVKQADGTWWNIEIR